MVLVCPSSASVLAKRSLFCRNYFFIISRCSGDTFLPSVTSWGLESIGSSRVTNSISCSSMTLTCPIMQPRLILKVLLVLLINRTGIAREGFVLARAFPNFNPGYFLIKLLSIALTSIVWFSRFAWFPCFARQTVVDCGFKKVFLLVLRMEGIWMASTMGRKFSQFLNFLGQSTV